MFLSWFFYVVVLVFANKTKTTTWKNQNKNIGNNKKIVNLYKITSILCSGLCSSCDMPCQKEIDIEIRLPIS
jgi:hypothetical protein